MKANRGGDWKAASLRKKGKASRTPGKSKGPSCQTDATKKFFLTHPHAHRLDPARYETWHQQARAMNDQKMGGK